MLDDKDKRYKIVRFRRHGNQEVIRRGLTLDEARDWCRQQSTNGKDWFDGFTQESK
jgi:hypothetical protein